MNDREQMKIDVISGMDDEIVERNTKKRSELEDRLGNRRFRRAWIPILAGAACFFFLFATVLLLFPDKKQVPIYQGMTVSNTPASYEARTENGGGAAQLARPTAPRDFLVAPVLSVSPDISFFANAVNNGNNGNHYGQQKQTETDTVVESEPLTETETETEVPSTLTDFSAERYFAKPNEDIYITIHFSNPDKFEILSFTLNGEKFSNYMFEAGSDMEHLVLKQNVGSVCGLVEFTIDAIKYVDGTEIKDVQMDGDRTVEVGVYEDALPRLAVDKVATDFFTVGCELNLTEHTPTLLRLSEGKVRAALYLEDARVAEQAISLEEWGKTISVSFGELLSGMDYRVTLEALFDARDGKGETTHVLWEKTLHTKEALSVTATEVTQDAATFTIEWAEEYPQKEFVGVLLLPSDGAEARPIDPDTLTVRNDPEDSARTIYELTVAGLLSGYEYTLAVSYPNRDVVSVVTDKILTEAKTAPTYVVDGIETTQGTISFDVIETDPDSIGMLTKIELLKDGTVVKTAPNVETRTFDGLLSDHEYTLRVTFVYDLNDGAGEQTATVTKTVMTEKKITPIYTLEEENALSESLSFVLTKTDPDEVGAVTKIELLDKDGTVVKTAPNVETRTFDGLLSDHEYTLRVIFVYDLNDGAGEQTATVTKTVMTEKKITPVYTLEGENALSESLSFVLTETDPDEVGAVTKIELLDKDGTVIETAPNEDVRRFEGLESQTVYTVRVTYEYDLNDGSGVKTETKTCSMAYGYVPVTQLSTDEDTVLLTGETLPLKLTLQRPTGVEFDMISAKVNGVEYALSRLTANTYGITYAPGIQSGRETLKITGLSYTVNGQRVTDYAEHAPTLAITVRGDVTVENVILSQNGAYFEYDEDVTATVTLKGAEGYDQMLALVDSEGREYPLTWVEGDTYRVDLFPEYAMSGIYTLVLETVKVMADGAPAEVNVRSEKICYVVLDYGFRTVTDIRTPEELQNMESGRAYRLADHIDLTGFDWVPYAFDGVLYGNGYEIRNLDMYAVIPVGEFGEGFSMGMFTELTGYFKDVILKNAYVELESRSWLEGMDINSGYGLLAGQSGFAGILLDGCTVEGQLYIHTPGAILDVAINGFVGAPFGGVLKNCRFEGKISVEGSPLSDGGARIYIYPLRGDTVLDCSYEFEASVNEHRSTGDFLIIYPSDRELIMSTRPGEEIVIVE